MTSDALTDSNGSPSLADRVRQRPLVHKLWKYSMTSVVGVTIGQSMIFLFASVLDWSWGLANIAAVAIGTGPTYLLSRRWVWRKDGKSSLYAEVVPFWVMSFLGLLLSTLVVVLLERRYPDEKLLANVGNMIGFGVLWIAKFFVLDRILFKVTHEHIETPTPIL